MGIRESAILTAKCPDRPQNTSYNYPCQARNINLANESNPSNSIVGDWQRPQVYCPV
uniref:Uncharacterized protein n=1 Tax=Arion vulgaris TaxID=1028688 RepID=A0A0B7AMZ6_9EUPU